MIVFSHDQPSVYDDPPLFLAIAIFIFVVFAICAFGWTMWDIFIKRWWNGQ